ncbi:MAG: hypothetical protein GXO48_04845 [Chlorobi bacterium]|nr:hypothetical protein [Chlorobiota bacterium]
MRVIRKFITAVFGFAFAIFNLVFILFISKLIFTRIFETLGEHKLWAYISSALPFIAFLGFALFSIRVGWASLVVLLDTIHALKAHYKKHRFYEKQLSHEERKREEHATLLVGLFNVLFFSFSVILMYIFYRGVAYYYDLEGFGPFEVFVASLVFAVAYSIVSLVAWTALLVLTVNLSDEDIEKLEEPL